nr:E3 SUMO-protein ligase ZBED1-like isoform X1 [Hydra vulgaris]
MVGALLDPRFKTLPFLTTEEKTSVITYAEELHAILQQQPVMGPAATASASSKCKVFDSFHTNKKKVDLLSRIYKPVTNASSVPTTFRQEMQIYLSEDPEPLTGDPLTWWKSHSSRFNLLSRLAAQLFCVTATSCPCERIFSTAGNFITKKRNQLTPEHAEMLVFLYENSELRGNLVDNNEEDDDDDGIQISSDD